MKKFRKSETKLFHEGTKRNFKFFRNETFIETKLQKMTETSETKETKRNEI